MRKITIFLALLLVCSVSFAKGGEGENGNKENEFNVGVQIRPRAEYRNGVISPRIDGQDPAFFVTNRARMTMGYTGERLSIGLGAQHVGVWGQDPQIDKNGRFILNEAWANLDMGGGFFAKLGRQSLVYDDDRILGSLDWNVAGRFHDALKLGFENPGNKLHLILSFNQNDEKLAGTYYTAGAQPYKSMQTLWYQYIANKKFDASFLLMNLGLQAGDETTPENRYLQTLGTNLSYKPGKISLYGTAYYQMGKNMSNQDVSAYMFALNAAYQVNPMWRFMVATDYLSGDSGESATEFKAFDPLYGTHHKFYGTMDYFYASRFIDGRNPGLWDNQVGVTCKASPSVTLLLNYHYFMTTADVYVGTDKQKKGVGSEVDLQVNWNIMKDVNLSAGYSTMFGTDTFKVIKGGDPKAWQGWGWISLNINPKVFVSKW